MPRKIALKSTVSGLRRIEMLASLGHGPIGRNAHRPSTLSNLVPIETAVQRVLICSRATENPWDCWSGEGDSTLGWSHGTQ